MKIGDKVKITQGRSGQIHLKPGQIVEVNAQNIERMARYVDGGQAVMAELFRDSGSTTKEDDQRQDETTDILPDDTKIVPGDGGGDIRPEEDAGVLGSDVHTGQPARRAPRRKGQKKHSGELRKDEAGSSDPGISEGVDS